MASKPDFLGRAQRLSAMAGGSSVLQLKVVVILAVVSLSSFEPAWGQPGAPPSPVVVSKVEATSQPASQSFVGTLQPVRKSVVGSAVDGRVVRIFVDNGDRVRMTDQEDTDSNQLGQPIVQLRTVSLDIEIAAAEVELEILKHAEEQLKRTLPTEVAGATAAIAEIKARLKYAKSDYDRLKDLNEKGGGIARREIDEAFSAYSAQLQSNISAESLLKRLTTTREVRLSQAKSRVEAQETEIRRLQELKEKYTIRTPFDGYVTSKMSELGEWVSRGDNVMEIVDLDPIELRINVPQSYIGRLQNSLDKCRKSNTKYQAQVTIESIPGLLTGDVVRIVPQADLRSRSFPVIIRIDNPGTDFGHLLKSGMLATASLFVGRPEEILLVKKDALVLGGRETSLFVAASDPQTQGTVVRPVSVKIGASLGNWIQVTGAIAQGDKVVIEGNERLRPGQAVQIVKEDSDPLPVGNFQTDASSSSPSSGT